MVRQISPDKALVRLEEQCAKAEYSTGELRRKLYHWRIFGDEADKIIESLESRRFVDNDRFAKVFVRDKYRFNRWGRLKIRQELRAKGVSADAADLALGEIDEDIYLESLRALIMSKNNTLKNCEGYERRLKLFRAAVARGYEPNLVSRILKDMKFEEKEDDL